MRNVMPLRDRISFTSAGNSAGGRDFAFHKAPITYASFTSPRSNATSTSSPTSGTNQVPRFRPAIIVATRAQRSPLRTSVGADTRTRTRPRPSGSRLSTTEAE